MAEDVKRMLGELNERRESSIERYCNCNGLDARNAAHYAKTASEVCEYIPETCEIYGPYDGADVSISEENIP